MHVGWVVAVTLGALAVGGVWLTGRGGPPHGRTAQSPPLAAQGDDRAARAHRETNTTIDPPIAVPERHWQWESTEPTNGLDESDPAGRRLAIHALYGRTEPVALGALGDALDDEDPEIRWAALRVVTDLAVRGYQAPEITALLGRALSDPDPALRSEALDALAQGGAKGLVLLERALADPADEVRARAAALLEAAQQ